MSSSPALLRRSSCSTITLMSRAAVLTGAVDFCTTNLVALRRRQDIAQVGAAIVS